jgi:hypothetical protein
MSRKDHVQLAGWAILSASAILGAVLLVIAATVSVADQHPVIQLPSPAALTAVASR